MLNQPHYGEWIGASDKYFAIFGWISIKIFFLINQALISKVIAVLFQFYSPLNFKLRYEFVDLYQDGIPIFGTHECNRKFVSGLIERREPTTFRSIRNIFLFGRGGARNLNCTYRFEAQRGERIHIVIRKVITKNRKCSSQIDRDINRSYCFGNTDVRIEVSTIIRIWMN